MVVHTSNPSSQEVEALHKESWVNLGSTVSVKRAWAA